MCPPKKQASRGPAVTGKKRSASKKDVDGAPHTKRQNVVVAESVPVLWEGWKDIFFVGTEFSNYDMIFEQDWRFEHLAHELTEGELAQGNVYLFGGTEAIMVKREKTAAEVASSAEGGSGLSVTEDMVVVPVINAVVSTYPPPNSLGIKSVMMEEEEVIPGHKLKLDWVPYIELDDSRDLTKQKCRIFLYRSTVREAVIRRMSDHNKRVYEYANLFVLKEKDVVQDNFDTEVSVCDTVGGRQLVFDFDWEMDNLNDMATEVLEGNEMDVERYKDELKEKIRDTVRKRKQAIREEKEKQRERWTSLPQEQRDAINTMQLYKFYPQHPHFDLSRHKVSFVNRYYGKASKVF